MVPLLILYQYVIMALLSVIPTAATDNGIIFAPVLIKILLTVSLACLEEVGMPKFSKFKEKMYITRL